MRERKPGRRKNRRDRIYREHQAGERIMHIAIVEDNIADRHQSERIIGREGKRRTTDDEGYYIDSMGSFDAVLPFPTLYNMFFIDMTDSPEGNGLDLCIKLMNKGAFGYFILMSSKIDYRKEASRRNGEIRWPDHLRFLTKPVLTKDLSDLFTEIIPLCKDRPELVEIRGITDDETYHLDPDEIRYAVAIDDHNCRVFSTLPEHSQIFCAETVDTLFRFVEDFDQFYYLSAKKFINLNHMKDASGFRYHMDDGSGGFCSPACTKEMMQIKKEMKEG